MSDTTRPVARADDSNPSPAARRHTVIPDTPVGPLTVVAEGDAVVGVWMVDQRHAPDPSAFGVPAEAGDTLLERAAEELTEYLTGERREFDLPLAPRGTAFQERVWAGLREIPYGETWSYGELAEHIGSAGAARAVGLANGRNPIGIVIPCHRVVGSTGSLTGYGGGIERKRFLLDLERRTVEPGLFEAG